MAEITWTAEAERWLKDIYDYIAQDNPEAATPVIEGIYQRAQTLAAFPEIGYKNEYAQRPLWRRGTLVQTQIIIDNGLGEV